MTPTIAASYCLSTPTIAVQIACQQSSYNRFTRAKVSKLAHVRPMERQNDVLLRHSHFDELIGNSCFCAVMLHPDFAVLDIQVQNAAKIAFVPAPTHIQQLVVVML